MSNEIVPFEKQQVLAAAIVKSGLFGLKTVDQALALMAICEAQGLHPAQAAQDYYIVNGRPTLKADAMLARFQIAGGKISFDTYTDQKVSATFTHPQGGTITVDWTIERAKQAGLGGKDVWKSYPRAMLRARVISEGIRTIYPGVAVGVYTPEEAADFPPEKNMGSAEIVAKPIRAVDAALGDWDEQHPEEMESIRETAALVVQMIEIDGNPVGAYQYVLDQNLDSDQMTAFWKVLGPNTKTRAALKKEGAVRTKDSRGEVANAVEGLHSQQTQAAQ